MARRALLALALGLVLAVQCGGVPSVDPDAACAADGGGGFVWPQRNWTLRQLSEEDYAFWERNGYVVVKGVVPPELCRGAAGAIREFVGADDARPETWYANTLDVYEDVEPGSGKKPLHGPCGMVQLFHHASLWAIRQLPAVHEAFADLYGTERLWVSTDRAHFKPPEDARFPAWSDPGEVHRGLHWDVDTSAAALPVPFAVQGVVYLEDTPEDAGAMRLVPGFHRSFANWTLARGGGEGAEGTAGLEDQAVPAAGGAGDLVLWHPLLPHGPGRNVGLRPRVSAYVGMLPVDAAPFLGPRRAADSPLFQNDAGTLAYFEAAFRSDTEAKGGVRRLGREERAELWRRRLPLLREDPKEDELPRRPPGEAHGRPAELTALGEKLAGVREWD